MKQLVFGEISRAEAEKQAGIALNNNPMVGKFGIDPMGRTCKFCRHMFKASGGSRSYWKCALRGDSRSTATDHRQKWQACGKYDRAVKGSVYET